ncbi:transglycosylase domain-containing protein [Streptomyces sp. DSM 15324]|uniref:transglycosylase domain-containing protein n=1 Tax=Streptomyces sp. DSM 15324 TaxID=1739111 RepID=UPI000746DB10|nr:transglycosylase domain-containing protein [Streptomyces sp. DSM 15324]KUO13648.1 penicillin-binding protein [Streptomyces sp. DSM 15324]
MSDEPQPQQPTEGWAPSEQPGEAKMPKRPKRTGWRRLIPTWRMVLATFVLGVLLLIGLFYLGYSTVKIPPANALATKQSNVYLYADGTEIARDGEINRESVDLSQISKAAQHAILAAEDRDFYTESAVDPKAMLRAGWNTATGKGKQSGSTITQQYVKNYYLAQEQTAKRKVKEFFIAIKLDREKSKDEILEGYLNTSYFGRNAYGIEAAAKAYYGIDASTLTPEQGAYLAALVNAPSEYDVIAHPENKRAAQARWNYVLDGMVTKGWLDKSKREGMKFPTPKETSGAATGMSGQRGYLVNAIKDYLLDNKIVTSDKLDAGGYRITTTIQKKKQNAFVDAVNDKLMNKLDKKNRKVDTYVRAGGAAVDPKTGKILALYGGIDYIKQYTNNATRQDFQVGSTFKPFVFTSAVENDSTTQDGRTITPNTVYDGTNRRPVQGWSGGSYAPENEDYVNYGNITVRQATDKSVNSVYAQMAVDVGPSKVKQTAIALGLPTDTPDLQPYPSIALGTATASVLDMAEAYATLANHGKHGTYTIIDKLTKDGKTVELPKRKTTQAVSRQAADTTTSVLQSVVNQGTATAALAAGRPAAGKTGTAEEDQAAWFAGYTPDLATVVAVMGQDPETAAHKSLKGAMGLARINGGGAPTEIWAQFTKEALKNTKVHAFDLDLQAGSADTGLPTGPSSPAASPSGDGTTAGGQGDQGQAQGQTGGGGTDGGSATTGTTGGTPGGGTSTGTADGGTGDAGTTTGTGDAGTTTGTGDAGTTAGTGDTGTPGGPQGTTTGTGTQLTTRREIG